MKLDNNKDFYERLEVLTNHSKSLEPFKYYLCSVEPESFDSIELGILISTIENELDSSSLLEIIESYNKRFLRGLDIE